MSVRISRGPTDDPAVVALRDCLEGYVRTHSGASAELYRRSPASIAVRVVDPGFAGTNRLDRHGVLWHYLAERVPDEVMDELGVLLTVTPAEAKTTIGSLEFDDPYLAGAGLGLVMNGASPGVTPASLIPTTDGGLSITGAPPAGPGPTTP